MQLLSLTIGGRESHPVGEDAICESFACCGKCVWPHEAEHL
ncbi:MAG: hypothetical protein QOF40_3439, partial [Actinomycetota bacterium]|nr:hypothetical protein [Actinomycetota bacterium]